MDDAPAPTAAESTEQVLYSLTQGLPKLMQAVSQNLLPVEQAQLEATKAVSPGYTQLQTDLYGKYGPQLSQIGSDILKQQEMAQIATDTGALTEANKPGGLLSQALSGQQQLDPEYYKAREAAGGQLTNLLNSIDVNGLSGSERAEVSRSLARDNAATGNTSPSALSTVGNAMTFGSALEKKRNSLENALATAAQITPTFKSGQDAFQMTTGRSSSSNPGGAQFVGNTQTGNTTKDMTSNLLGQISGFQNNAANINANRRDTLDRMQQINQMIMSAKSCCFLFMVPENGPLPDWVRPCRNVMHTPDSLLGYTIFAGVAVYFMARSKFCRQLINDIMIAPLTAYGGYLFGKREYSYGRAYKGYAKFWFTTWGLIGKVARKLKH